jgi:chromosome segregation ATPase
METKPKKGPKPFTIEQWKDRADSNRKRAEYWEKEHQELEEKLNMVQLNYKSDIATLQQSNKELLSGKNHFEKLAEEWYEDSHQNLIKFVDLENRYNRLTSVVESYKTDIEKLHKEKAIIQTELNAANFTVSSLQKLNTTMEVEADELKNKEYFTRILAWVGWIFVFILLGFRFFIR